MRVIRRDLHAVAFHRATDEHCTYTACGDLIHRENSPLPLPPIEEQETHKLGAVEHDTSNEADTWLL
jgi:hypothetical protein